VFVALLLSLLKLALHFPYFARWSYWRLYQYQYDKDTLRLLPHRYRVSDASALVA